MSDPAKARTIRLVEDIVETISAVEGIPIEGGTASGRHRFFLDQDEKAFLSPERFLPQTRP